jgi:hypothetical protein
VLAFLNENVAGASVISPAVHLSFGGVRHLLSFMLQRSFLLDVHVLFFCGVVLGFLIVQLF